MIAIFIVVASASILIIATLIVGMNATGIIAKICQTISIGAVCVWIVSCKYRFHFVLYCFM